jgi:hypothetical protein
LLRRTRIDAAERNDGKRRAARQAAGAIGAKRGASRNGAARKHGAQHSRIESSRRDFAQSLGRMRRRRFDPKTGFSLWNCLFWPMHAIGFDRPRELGIGADQQNKPAL